MEKQYKSFDDLVFEDWANRKDFPGNFIARMYAGHKQAIMEFPNGYGVSVLLGSTFYSDEISTYEVAVTKAGGGLAYPPEICPDDDVLGYRTKEQVTEIMKLVQDL